MTPPEIALQNKRGIEREIRKTRTKLQNPCHPIGKKVDLGVFVCVSVSKTPFSCCCSRLGQSERNSILRDDTLLTEGPLNEAKGHADGRRLSLFFTFGRRFNRRIKLIRSAIHLGGDIVGWSILLRCGNGNSIRARTSEC